MTLEPHSTFGSVIEDIRLRFATAPLVKPSHWQGRNVSSKPDMETYELLNHSFALWLPDEDLTGYRDDIGPDVPWADDHFAERVCGYPLNPGKQWRLWRLGKPADDFRDADGRFNHNYMERIWPKFARKVPPAEERPDGRIGRAEDNPHSGILYEYGDLYDVLQLLLREPLTRQAYLPIFFPEDTGGKGRCPCTLGWHFIRRDDRMHIVYPLRSCDVINHFRNDVYMAVRLLIWMLEGLRSRDPQNWDLVVPGTLTMHITSLHCFRGQIGQLTGEP
jgi:hypothetical protein